MKKILIVSPVATHPQRAGNSSRVYNLADILKQYGFDVYFLFIKENSVIKSEENLKTMNDYWGDNLFIYNHRRDAKIITFIKRALRKLNVFYKKIPIRYSVDEWVNKNLISYVESLNKKIKFDVVITEYVFYSKILNCFDKNTIKILDTHDVFTKRDSLYLKNNEKPLWFYTNKKNEKKGLNRADIVIAIQEKEAKFFSEITNKKVITVGHLIQKNLKINNEKKQENHILFVGSENLINVNALEYFIKEIFPAVLSKIPDAKLLIAGKVASGIRNKFNSCVKLGEIDNIEIAYNQANVAINPTIFGTGLKIKTIEAIGYSTPIVTTSIGAEGINIESNALFIADNPKQFADKIIEILKSKELQQDMIKSAEKFTSLWNEQNIKELLNVLK